MTGSAPAGAVDTRKERAGERRGVGAVVAGGARRSQSRNVRARLAALQRARREGPMEEDTGGMEEEEEDDDVEEMVESMIEREERKVGKVGTKKLRRIQEKAERKAMHEASLKSMYVSERFTVN